MNYNCIENLSEDEILQLYNDTIENNSTFKAGVYFEVQCTNGISGYIYEVNPTSMSPRVGRRNIEYTEYGYHCYTSAFANVVCRICGDGVAANTYGINSNIYSEQASDCQNEGGAIIVSNSGGTVCKIPKK